MSYAYGKQGTCKETLLETAIRWELYVQDYNATRKVPSDNPVQSHVESIVQVYLPMSYMYGKRGTCKETPLTAAVRGELYVKDYNTIDWNAARNQCAKEDLYYPHPKASFALANKACMATCANKRNSSYLHIRWYPHPRVMALRAGCG